MCGRCWSGSWLPFRSVCFRFSFGLSLGSWRCEAAIPTLASQLRWPGAGGANVAICTLYLWLQVTYGKFPTTSRELRVIVVLLVIGFLMTTCLIPSLATAARLLEQRKKSRPDRGRRFQNLLAHCHPLALRGRDLRSIDLSEAFLVDTDLSDTDLRGVDLSGAILENVSLHNAIYDSQTRWPDGFDPRRGGARRVD
jgi:hypothetical protein